MLIVEMEMPSRCGECKMHFLSGDGYVCCGITDRIPKIVGKYHNSRIDLDEREKSINAVQKPSWCPIKGVLPDEHGDLIDRDKAIFEMCEGLAPMRYRVWAKRYLKSEKINPTVIAAERKDDADDR